MTVSVQKPTLGRIVWYRSRTGDYDVSAIVAVSWDSIHWPNVDKGHIVGLTDEWHVHLVVFSAGKPGMRVEAANFKVESPHGRSENIGGSYTELDIPYDPDGAPGTWRWPEIQHSNMGDFKQGFAEAMLDPGQTQDPGKATRPLPGLKP